jgi:hypothetical protein
MGALAIAYREYNNAFSEPFRRSCGVPGMQTDGMTRSPVFSAGLTVTAKSCKCSIFRRWKISPVGAEPPSNDAVFGDLILR